MVFEITEDDLTNAIFYNSAVNATGAGTKADARIRAHNMLTGLARVHEYLVEYANEVTIDKRQYAPGSERETYALGKLVALTDTMKQVQHMIDSEDNSGTRKAA